MLRSFDVVRIPTVFVREQGRCLRASILGRPSLRAIRAETMVDGLPRASKWFVETVYFRYYTSNIVYHAGRVCGEYGPRLFVRQRYVKVRNYIVIPDRIH